MNDKPDWHMSKQELLNCLNDDALFDELLIDSLQPVSPPEDFSARVMAAIADEPVAHPAKVIQFPWRRCIAGLGICAAAFALFIGVSALDINDNPTVLLANKPAQINRELTPALVAPTMAAPTEKPTDSAQSGGDTTDNNNSTNTSVNDVTDNSATSSIEISKISTETSTEDTTESQTEALPLPVKSDELVLPRAAYGTETEGTLSTRLIATIEGNHLYQPSFAGKNAVFNTADAENVYSWRVNVSDPSEPECSAMAAWSDLPAPSEVLRNTTATVEATTLVASPDKTMLAQNSADGVWVSLLDGDVFKLTGEGKGSLLAWSPDSSKLVFTNANGALFVGYPLERRIYQLAESSVKDVCWHSNNKTLLYVTAGTDEDALYIVETY